MTLRRDFLGFTAGAVAARTVLPAAVRAEGVGRSPSPDADLLAACAEYLRIQRAFEAHCISLPGNIRDDDPAWGMLAARDRLVEQIVATRAVTAEGHMARARCAAFHYLPRHSACQDDPDQPDEDRFIAAGLRDLVAMERGTGTQCRPAAEAAAFVVPPPPDAELLEACVAFDRLEHAYVAAGGDHLPGSPQATAAEAERERIAEAQEPMVERICELRATTREGQAARARSLALWDAELMKADKEFTGDRLMAAIVRDMIS